MKKISLLMALLFVLLLASCGKTTTNDPTKETETIPESTVSAEEAGFVLEDVVRANNVKTLVAAHGSVQVTRTYDGEMSSDAYYFMYAGKLVSTCCYTDEGGETGYYCVVDGKRYDKDGDHLTMVYDLEPEGKEEPYTIDADLTDQMLEGTIRWIEAPDEETWRFELRDEKEFPGIFCRCTVARETLLLQKIEWDYGEEGTSETEIKCGDAVQTKEFGLLDGFAKPLRTVTCVSTLHNDAGKETEKTVKLEVPYNAEPVWVGASELNAYLDKDLTKEYKYPGNGEDGYTVYVTDAMG